MREGFDAFNAVFINHDNLAIFHFADKRGADDVEGRFLTPERVSRQITKNQRADAERVTRPDQFFVGQHDQTVAPWI